MNIYVYSDESGVFDKKHNEVFVFGGVILLGNDAKQEWSRKYAKAENDIRLSKKVGKEVELKATSITNKEKGKLFRSLNGCFKFGVVVNQNRVLDRIFDSKKDKKRYLDYAYKIAVKMAFKDLIEKGKIKPEEVERIYFFVDEHSTATNGRYELKEALEQEFKYGTYNWKYDKWFAPIFPDLKEVQVEFCNSKSKRMVRAADIVANKIYYLALNRKIKELSNIKNINVISLP